jgi:parallel beta-helix repeat protein
VSPSDDDRTTVQTMFEEAQDGETLCFSPGTYSFDDGVTLSDLDGITVRGTGADRDDVVLDFFPMGTGNSGLNISGMTRFTIENVRVLDAAQNNVFITDSTDVIIRNVSSGWVQRPPESAGKYAIYPVLSQRVLIEDSEAFGSADAGLYVGQTQDCVVRNNLAYENVAVIEMQSSGSVEPSGTNVS